MLPLRCRAQYADPVMDKLDIHKVITHRLFRESCTFYKGNYVKVQLSTYPRVTNLCIAHIDASFAFHSRSALDRTSQDSAANCETVSSLTIRPRPTFSSPSTPCRSLPGSTTRTTRSSWISSSR